MRNSIPFILFIPIAALMLGCESKAGTGALVGAGGGALIGGVAGGGTGALIGAGAGAVGGAIIGAALDSSDRSALQKRSPKTVDRIDNGQQLSVDDIIQMNKAGISDDVIISQIQRTDSRFNLTSSQIVQLKRAGVSDRVIDYMINA